MTAALQLLQGKGNKDTVNALLGKSARQQNSELQALRDGAADYEQNGFFQHFQVEEMVTFKCVVARCRTMQDRHFLLKQIPNTAVQLQDFLKRREGGVVRPARRLNAEMLTTDISVADAWINLPIRSGT